MQVMPFLSPFIGPGRFFNWLIRNQWRNDEAIAKLGQLPVLLISSIEVISIASLGFAEDTAVHAC